MKLTYSKPEIELNEYKFADVMNAGAGLSEFHSYDTSHNHNAGNEDTNVLPYD